MDAVRLLIFVGRRQVFHPIVVPFADVAIVGGVGVVPLHHNECLRHGIFWALNSFLKYFKRFLTRLLEPTYAISFFYHEADKRRTTPMLNGGHRQSICLC